MKKNLLFLVSFLFVFSSLFAQQQRNCSTMDRLEILKNQDPTLEERMEKNEKILQQWIKNNPDAASKSTVLTIPVVVHVVYNNSTENISDAQVQSQIDILNEDFRRTNSDASNTPSGFQSVAADCEIEFCLASQDPNGNNTNGITRTSTTQTSFGYSNDGVKYTSSGGIDAWNTSEYMNIWVCDLSSGLLGYAQFPGGPASSDGIVCDYAYFGNIGTATAPFNLGRTATHEVGHYLNLRHIWGDSNCGNDFCNDTPEHNGSNYGCPNYPSTSSCSGNGAYGDMFMNYMDYTDDGCMNMFSQDQKTRMIAAINQYRSGLLTSNACQPSGYGCTDPTAYNYDPNAVTDNGTCCYVSGCTDATACNYDANACYDDGSCQLPDGCTDPSATNYDPNATCDDGTCCFGGGQLLIDITTDNYPQEISWELTTQSGTVIASINAGDLNSSGTNYSWSVCVNNNECYNFTIYDTYGDGICCSFGTGAYTLTYGGSVVASGGSYGSSETTSNLVCGSAVFGCTDPNALNYDPAATTDDGSCCYSAGCTDANACNYDANACYDDGSCQLPDGCTDPAATNYDPNAICDDGSCIIPGLGCTDSTAYNYDPSAINDDGSCCYVNGCTDPTACNYEPNSCYDDGSCILPDGCTDTLASNYDSLAICDDGSCVYSSCTLDEVTLTLYDSYGDGWNANSITINGNNYALPDINGDYTTTTVWDQFPDGYGPVDTTICVDLSQCIDVIYNPTGAYQTENTWEITDINGVLLNSGTGNTTGFTTSFGACPVYGCTDPAASNYDPAADTDDGSCLYPGCTDSTATNYDPSANDDDGSCIYACNSAPYCQNFDAGAPADWTNNGWVLNSGGTPSNGTGPSDDITGGGNYMYYEVSSGYSPVVTLTSCVDISALTAPTLSFYYHMNGSAVGTLDILVNGNNVSSISGSQGNQWNFTQIDLSSYTGSITIDFVGTYGGSWQGDIAIDEVCVSELIVIDGCTDPNALNYDPAATNDDGSCIYCTDNNVDIVVDGGTWQSEVSWNLLASDGTVLLSGGAPYSGSACLPDDCYTVDMSDTYGDGWNGNTFDASVGGVSVGNGTLSSGSSGSFTFELGLGSCTSDTVYGCTDSAANNYDPAATIDDGSCTYTACTLDEVTLTLFDSYGDGWNANSITINGNNYAIADINGDYTTTTVWDIYPDGFGPVTITLCVDLSQCIDVIYNPTGAYQDENSWTITDSNGTVLNSGTGNDIGFTTSFGATCPILGCTDPAASNYDPLADTDDGSCCYGGVVTITTNIDYQGTSYPWSCNGMAWSVNLLDDSTVLATGVTTNGCTDLGGGAELCLPDGCYEFVATDNSGYGSYATYTINDSSYSGIPATTLFIVGSGSCTGDIYGCTDSTAFNYDPAATIDDGSCVPFIYGCTDPNAFNYDANANTDDGSCVPFQYGCTDPAAMNYNPSANADDGSCLYPGCTDPSATNYDPNANFDDGSCIASSCTGDAITGLFVSNIIDDRCVLNFDNMNTYDAQGNQICRVDQIRIRYRPVGTNAWGQKNIASPTGYDPSTGVCNSTQKTDKNLYGLTLATTYEWQVKVWYCTGQTTGWEPGPNFTTADECPNIGNLAAYGANPTKATFTWDDSNGSYEFVRIKIRVDSISNPVLSDFIQVGGAGVPYGTFTKDKNGLTPGETYRGQGRTWCDPNGGAYNSLAWGSFGTWTQPTSNRIEGGVAISKLDVYPNPSDDIFNITFTSDDVQDLRVRVLNIIGEEIIAEDLQQFIGEYTKKIDLQDNAKGIYFLEIETNTGVVNKKLILQ